MNSPTETARRQANKTSVLELLRERGSAGATNAELLAVGGYRYGARIHELRRQGLEIDTERVDKGLFRFILKGQMGLFA